MDPFIELTNQLALLSQQLRIRQLTNQHQRRVTTQTRSQVWQPYASMDFAQYGGTPYLNNHNFGWSQHPKTSWNTSYTTLHTPQVQRSNLEEEKLNWKEIKLNWLGLKLNFQDQGLKWTTLKLGCLSFLIKMR